MAEARFEQFVKDRRRLRDWADYLSRDYSQLARWKILEACGFPRSTLYQNSMVKQRLAEVEEDLRRARILCHSNPTTSGPIDESALLSTTAVLNERLNKLKHDTSDLSEFVEETRRQIRQLHQR